MSDFIGDKQCVTCHFACACREARMAKKENILREALMQIIELGTKSQGNDEAAQVAYMALFEVAKLEEGE